MFHKCENLLSIDLSRLDTSRVTSFIYMFEKCINLLAADVSNLNIKQIFSSDSRMNSFFKSCERLKYLNIQKVQYINVAVLDSFFGGLNELDLLIVCEDRNYVEGNNVKILCCDYNIKKKLCESTNSIRLYFSESVKYKSFMNKYREKVYFITYNDNEFIENEINISPGAKLEVHLRLYGTKVSILRPGSLFGNPTLESFFDSNYDNNMKYLASVDFSNYNPDFIMNFKNMFYGGSSLKSVNFGSYFNGLITENMESMFQNCISLLSIDLSRFYAGVLANMKSTFEGCSSLISVNLSNFRINEIKNVENLFKGCSSLKVLDISNIDFSNNNENYLKMFDGINNLKYLRIYNINDTNKMISQSQLNKINDLIVCQNDNMITNYFLNICCVFNVEEEACESDNHIVLYFNKDSYYKNGFKNAYRENIYYMVYNKKTITGK